MYDMPATKIANDAFWQAIRANLGFGPTKLARKDNLWSIWPDPDMLFAQTCGFPYRAKLHGSVQLIGTPDYDLPGCPPGYYNSVFVCRADDDRDTVAAFDGARFAYNEALSQSGWAAPVNHMVQLGTGPGALVRSGGHALSAQTVATGTADFAALDALTWIFLERHNPDLTTQLRVLERTEPTPTLPYITSLTQNAQDIRAAVAQAIDDIGPDLRGVLHLHGLVDIPHETYLAVPTPPTPDALLN